MSFDGSNNFKLTNSATDQTPRSPSASIAAVFMGAPGEIGGDTPGPATFTDLDCSTMDCSGAATVGSTLAVAGTTSLNGAVNLGDAAGDNIDINGTISDDVLVGTNKKIQFRDSALSVSSSTDGQLDVDADAEVEIDTVNLDINATTTDISGALAVAGATTLTGLLTLALGGKLTGVAATATSDGTTTGTIPNGQNLTIAANGGSANNIIQLPAATVGSFGFIYTTGALELRTPTPASIAINGGTGSGAESAIPSGALVFFIYVTTTACLALQITSAGVVSGVEVAAP